MSPSTDRRWLALIILNLGTLMIVLDATIVNAALPSIRDDLGFTGESLAWVVNAYQEFLIAARAVQGLGGAVVSAVALSLVMMLFTETGERAKAMGVYGFVASGGGTIGVVAGGVLTDALNWHWIFLVNIPIGVAVYALSSRLLPADNVTAGDRRVDIAGAVTVTASLMLAVYAIVNGNEVGWLTGQTLGLLAASVVLIGVFLGIESRVSHPLMPLGLFRHRNVSTANGVAVLLAGSMFAWFFLTAMAPDLQNAPRPRRWLPV